LREMTAWMEEKGYNSIHDFKGAALNNMISTKEVVREAGGIRICVDEELCIGCGECRISCFYDAVTLKNRKAQINQGKCVVCGLCVEKCPTDAVHLLREEEK